MLHRPCPLLMEFGKAKSGACFLVGSLTGFRQGERLTKMVLGLRVALVLKRKRPHQSVGYDQRQ